MYAARSYVRGVLSRKAPTQPEQNAISLTIPQRHAHGSCGEASVSAASFVDSHCLTEQRQGTCVQEPAKLGANNMLAIQE